MNYEEAIEHDTLVSFRDVLAELENHGVFGDELTRFFDELGNHAVYKSRDVLIWLGY